jgi:regulator of cell morphogenesis and NO signaling
MVGNARGWRRDAPFFGVRRARRTSTGLPVTVGAPKGGVGRSQRLRQISGLFLRQRTDCGIPQLTARGVAGMTSAFEQRMMLIPNPTVASIVLEHPVCASVFQKYRIDFCCGGNLTVDEACAAKGLEAEAVRQELDDAIRERQGQPVGDPRQMSTYALVAHIVDKHHGYLRRSLPTILALATKVARVHGDREPKLRALGTAVQELVETLEPHLDHEEQSLFPALLGGRGEGPDTAGELADMMGDHLAVAALLERIHDASDGFQVPPWGCNSYRTLFSELRTLDGAVREHVHLENHVLVPRFAPRQTASSS